MLVASDNVPVRLTCGVLGDSRQAYCACLAKPVSDHELEDAYLTTRRPRTPTAAIGRTYGQLALPDRRTRGARP
jgi:hypothetical protein